jgi:hypothetical protein
MGFPFEVRIYQAVQSQLLSRDGRSDCAPTLLFYALFTRHPGRVAILTEYPAGPVR